MNKATIAIIVLLAAIAYQPLGDLAADLAHALSDFSDAVSAGFDGGAQ